MEAAVIVLYLVVLGVLGIYGFHRSQLLMLYFKHRGNLPKEATPFAELPLLTI